jgi:hypothetical protein
MTFMPQTMLVCICGTPVAPKWGGVRAGHTPNAEVVRFVASLDQAQAALANPQREAVRQQVLNLGAPRQQIQGLNRVLKKVEKTLGQLQAGNTPERISRGRTWRLPERQADNGRDYLVRALQDRGFEFREAREVVNAIFECMVCSLKRGEEVEVPWGMIRVVTAPAPKTRIRPHKLVRLNRSRRKSEVYSWGGVPMTRPPTSIACERGGSVYFHQAEFRQYCEQLYSSAAGGGLSSSTDLPQLIRICICGEPLPDSGIRRAGDDARSFNSGLSAVLRDMV